MDDDARGVDLRSARFKELTGQFLVEINKEEARFNAMGHADGGDYLSALATMVSFSSLACGGPHKVWAGHVE